MQYFQTQFLDFFKELASNNHKLWFDENRKTYENYVKKPFAVFIQDLIDRFKTVYPDIEPEAKNAIFRINRDIRFSKDKTPYKLFASALLSPTGRKNISNPGFYLELNPEKMAVYGGIYMPDNTQISKIRQYIAEHQKAFSEVISQPDFMNKYGEIQGEKQTRIPKELKEAGEVQPLIYNKQWYITAELPPETILQDNLMEIFMDYFQTALPLHNFINKALE